MRQDLTGDDFAFDPKLLRQTVEQHFSRVATAWPIGPARDWGIELLTRLRSEALDSVCALAAAQLAESLRKTIVRSENVFRADFIVTVSTFPFTRETARKNFFSGGYLNHMNSMLRLARGFDVSAHWAEMLFFCDGEDYSIMFTLFPNSGTLKFTPIYTLPIDLLTPDERRKLHLD